MGGWQLQVAPVPCQKDIISFVPFGMQDDSKVTVKNHIQNGDKKCQAIPVFS
jgi:hypothetical protein